MGHMVPTIVVLSFFILLQEVMPIPLDSSGAIRDKRSPCPDPCQRRDSRGICRMMFSCSNRLDPINRRTQKGSALNSKLQGANIFNAPAPTIQVTKGNLFNAPTNNCPGQCKQRDRFDICRVNFSCIVGRR